MDLLCLSHATPAPKPRTRHVGSTSDPGKGGAGPDCGRNGGHPAGVGGGGTPAAGRAAGPDRVSPGENGNLAMLLQAWSTPPLPPPPVYPDGGEAVEEPRGAP